MTLKDHILARIAAEGPMRLDDYMSTCLLHPTLGYYTSQTPFGQSGDFVTAPEISQMFGELIGLALAQAWLDQGAPNPFTLAELGPGRGTLMADLLRAARQVPGFLEAAEVILIEASPALQSVQQEALNPHPVRWLDNIADLPEQPLFLIANEFFDALPIRQFQRAGPNWRERNIGTEGGTLTMGLGPAQPCPGLSFRLDDTKDGDLIETCPAAGPIAEQIAGRIAARGGAALIVDYGDWRSLGDTLQAVQNHESVDPLSSPSLADLTAHVDFEALAMAASGCAYSRVTAQGVFLERLGITQRAQQLAGALSGSALENHIAAHRRLTHPAEMGNLFKVMALFPKGGTPPPGLDP